MTRGQQVHDLTYELSQKRPVDVVNIMFASVYAWALMTGMTCIEVAESIVAGMEASEELDLGWDVVKASLTIHAMEMEMNQ